MVVGVTQGFSKTLVITGVGYRAEVQGKLLVMNLGFSSDYIAAIPEGLTVTADAQGKVTITGINKQQVGEFSSQIRRLRKPEPYKGKGIRYENEVIRRKVGKTGVK
jgi:large subunit ribosomal protein L6